MKGQEGFDGERRGALRCIQVGRVAGRRDDGKEKPLLGQVTALSTPAKTTRLEAVP